MNQWNMAIRLMNCFPGSFINHNGEFIAHLKSNTYLCLADCESEQDIMCKVLEWLSRAASKGKPTRDSSSSCRMGSTNISEQPFPIMILMRYIHTLETAAIIKKHCDSLNLDLIWLCCQQGRLYSNDPHWNQHSGS